MSKRDWRLVLATVITVWAVYSMAVLWTLPDKPITDPLWIQISVAYPLVTTMFLCWVAGLVYMWYWAVRP